MWDHSIRKVTKAENVLHQLLQKRREQGIYRSLKQATGLVDFCSNDYLGLARLPQLQQEIARVIAEAHALPNGSTGSRLLAGNSALAEDLEAQLATFHATEAALLFNSGYDANIGLLASLPQRGDTLITDELIHASMIDGARLSYAERYKFRHNDLTDLEAKLRKANELRPDGAVYVAVESIYSMDGDRAPLTELVELCEHYGAALIVDEAHATGVVGPTGAGLVQALGLENRVLARVHTFGKALGVHGAVVVGSALLRDYLINFARSFVYTTALPPGSLLAIQGAYAHLSQHPELVHQLSEVVTYFQQLAAEHLPLAQWTSTDSPIQGLLVSGNEACRSVALNVQRAGFDVRPILSPTVPAGRERLRICLHAYNTKTEIEQLIATLQRAMATGMQ